MSSVLEEKVGVHFRMSGRLAAPARVKWEGNEPGLVGELTSATLSAAR